VGDGQGFVLNQLFGERLPRLALQLRDQIFRCPLGRAKGVGGQTRPLDIADRENFGIAGAARLISRPLA
jgi:hypothetical protein